MYNTSHQYDLSFVPLDKKEGMHPQIVFSIRKEIFGKVKRRLRLIVNKGAGYALEYLEEDYVEFVFMQHDLSGRVDFGYKRCGFVTNTDAEVNFHIELVNKHFQHPCALTINVLTSALLPPVEDVTPSNRLQQLDLETFCVHDMNGHNIGGYVSPHLVKWFRQQTESFPEETQAVSIPDPIIQAMQQAWRALSHDKDHAEHAEACNGWIRRDGRFGLSCFGNACDVGIYPEGMSHNWEEISAQFGCHNLDSAIQQLTLIAGLAKLCEIARQ